MKKIQKNSQGLFAEIALQQTGERGAVTGLVFRHLVNSVVNGVVTELLGALGNVELAGTGAVLGFHALLKIRLRARGNNFTEKFTEFRGMFRLFKRNALVGFRNFGVSLALCLTAHRKIHSDFRALAGEVSAEPFHNLFVFHLTVADVVLGRPGQLGGVFLLFDELRGRGFALGAS